MSTSIEKKPERALTPVDKQMLSLMVEFDRRDVNLSKLLPRSVPVDRFKEGIRFALAQNPDLLKCTPGSIMIACMKAAKLGVDVSGGALGHGYLVPYGDECTFVQGYKGLVALAVGAGIVKDMQPVLVYENDEFFPEEGVDPKFIHRPMVVRRPDQERGRIIAAYTRVTLPDGTRVIKGWLDLHDIARIESGIRSKKSPWNTPHRPEMIKKSSLRNGFKTLGVPASEQAQRLREAFESEDEDQGFDVEAEVVAPAQTTTERVKGRLKDASAALPPPGPSFSEIDQRIRDAKKPEYVSEEPTDAQLEQERAARKREPGAEG